MGRNILMFTLLMGLTIAARNQESQNLKMVAEGAFMVKAIYVDSEGVKWLGTSQGLYRYDDLSWTYYTDADHLLGNQVNALAYEKTENSDELWVATSEGVSVLAYDADGVTGSTSYTMEQGLLEDNVSAIAIDSRGTKFFGSAGGLTMFSQGKMDSIVYTEYYSNMFNAPVRQLSIYGDTLYIAQNGGIGRLVSDVDGITGASRWESSYGVTPYSANIRSVMVNGINQQYFGTGVGVETHTGYAAKENWGLYSTDDGLVNNDVISMAEEEDGGLWFGTFGGVSHLEGSTWTSYTTEDGLLNDTVYSIALDLDGSVWFGTASGVCRLKDGSFQDFITTIPEKQISPLMMHAYYQSGMQTIQLEYRLQKPEAVSARLYNIQGMLVENWDHLSSVEGENYEALPHQPQNAGSGLYVIQIIHGNQAESMKLFIRN